MAQSLTNLLYHLVFSTKHRQSLIGPELRPELYNYLGGILRGEGGILLEIGGMPDHVHLVAKLKADVVVADMLRRIKASSSKWVNAQCRLKQRFSWQAGYGAFTVSQSQLVTVCKYVRAQEEHHRKQSFQEEFLQLLKKHRIEYDERYLWD